MLFRKLALEGECLLWTGRLTKDGYGEITVDGRLVKVHRLTYELAHGPIPPGLVIDHTCHGADTSCAGGKTCFHRACCNPDHLEAVTLKVNVDRGLVSPPKTNATKTHCKRGHEFTPENTYINPTSKGRICRTCLRAYRAKWAKKNPKKTKASSHASRKRWEAANREHKRAYQKEWRARKRAMVKTK